MSNWVEPTVMRGVHPALRSVFPNGLRADVYALDGSLSVGFGLLAGGWCGVVGLPELGVEAAAEWGVDLSRLVLVPDAVRWLETIASLIDGLDVVLAASPGRIAPDAAQRLAARLRSRRSTLVVLGEWPRPHARIYARTCEWTGLGQGYGCLSGQRIEVSVVCRSSSRTAMLTRNGDGIVCAA